MKLVRFESKGQPVIGVISGDGIIRIADLLPEYREMNQLAAAVFQIAQEPNLFQHIPFQIVRFIHNQDASAATVGLLQQQRVQREQHVCFRLAVTRQVKIERHHLEKLLRG